MYMNKKIIKALCLSLVFILNTNSIFSEQQNVTYENNYETQVNNLIIKATLIGTLATAGAFGTGFYLINKNKDARIKEQNKELENFKTKLTDMTQILAQKHIADNSLDSKIKSAKNTLDKAKKSLENEEQHTKESLDSIKNLCQYIEEFKEMDPQEVVTQNLKELSEKKQSEEPSLNDENVELKKLKSEKEKILDETKKELTKKRLESSEIISNWATKDMPEDLALFKEHLKQKILSFSKEQKAVFHRCIHNWLNDSKEDNPSGYAIMLDLLKISRLEKIQAKLKSSGTEESKLKFIENYINEHKKENPVFSPAE